ncbi:hypothetical protein N7456_010655 [Penicillium angulare]|uniref:Uncharacterized protein n=1 Tax=Penicillium angulare TaxID=116970 RepID=A0A9W9F719_9EURO|nr:hypothetical protein N7456_010655 [Penicillium angulare]
MKPALMKDGTEERLDIFAFTESENMRPEPFNVRFIPRNEGRAAIILHEVAAARENLGALNRVSSIEKPAFV